MMDQHPLPFLTHSPIDPGSIDGEKATAYARGVLNRLNAALAASDTEALENCFYSDQASWKDQLALTWHLRTFRCHNTIAASFLDTARLRGLSSGITIDGEAVFLSATPALVCPESPIAYSPSLQDAMNFETDVFIIGAGNAAIALSACLKALGVESVMADRNAHPGDNWARRYDCMRFHVPTAFCDLPYMYRATVYDEELRSPHLLTRQDLTSQVRRYVNSFNLNTLHLAEIQWTEYDELAKKWTIAFQTPAGQCKATSSHLVLATGIGSLKPNIPYIAEPHIYKGISIHSAEYKNAKLLKEQGVKSVVLIGSANTAFDVLENGHSAGLNATMVARSPTYIVPLEYVYHQASLGTYDTESMQPIISSSHCQHLWTDSCVVDCFPRSHRLNWNDTPQSRQPGPCSQQSRTNSTCLDTDAIIWCTGFADSNVVTTATEILGGKSDVTVANTKIDDQTGRAHVLTPGGIASHLDTTWGVDEEGEIRGMWKRHSHVESIWIMGGYTQQHWWYSRILALQIKAALQGILPPAYRHDPAPEK
ncbi:uncharacterized protein ANIA_00586 [Aspergillus nidulans FGSC A4]|uniref:FAD/NAD(P)-binding domain-containing protein n=1 Tax=Emericella nidulans (strain FGSC A4 / ATCC 38163 / CBS 112.46 / NRRL 194 / M139) TaxID=227321 RepID=C8VSC1_EMENI|nr:hypothetical protein [Aspergillus nidulans FGSC A4]CBF89179.1 TPA: conserved hypothetical protein [Aspergillus nidulans FGSC A4]